MLRKTFTTIAAIAVGFAMAGPASAFIAGDGKGKPERDCYIGLDGYSSEDLSPINKKGTKFGIVCTDCDPACDLDGVETPNGTCTFSIAACVNQPGIEGCDPATRETKKTSAKAKSKAGKLDLASTLPSDGSSACSAFVDFPVPTKKNGKKAGKGKVTLKATKKTDKDKFTFVCNPRPEGESCTGGTTTTTLPGINCVDNPDGGPDEWILTIGEAGNDLDNGWTGISHNFPVTPNGVLEMCLTGCDGSADTVCDGSGPIGEGTVNGVTFGAPLPLLAAGVPVCVVNRFARDVTGTIDLVTGESFLDVGLLADVYFTDQTEVCPRCQNNGNCSSGQNSGKSCTTDATLVVTEGLGNTTYNLSRDCPPSGNPSTLVIDLPLTTGTTDPVLMGETPCTGPGGINPEPNDCSGSCDAACTGLACVEMVPDPSNPGGMICRDSKGGLSQQCCSDNTSRSCFPLEGGGTVSRTGSPGIPLPALPDMTYPKTSMGTLAAVFCEAATQTNTINLSTGLPGPAAILLTGPFSVNDNPAP